MVVLSSVRNESQVVKPLCLRWPRCKWKALERPSTLLPLMTRAGAPLERGSSRGFVGVGEAGLLEGTKQGSLTRSHKEM